MIDANEYWNAFWSGVDFSEFDDEELDEPMECVQLHDFGACSSVLLKNLTYPAGKTGRDLFFRHLRLTLAHPVPPTITLGANNPVITKDWDADYFAVVVASTNEFCLTAEECFRELGFTRTGPAHNEKNRTRVSLWSIPATTLAKNLKEVLQKYKIDDGVQE